MKNKYVFAALSCYINYFAFGMAYIMIGQNMSFLSEKLNTDNAGVSFLISAYGFGRLFSYFFAGKGSDKFGRKPFVMTGALLCAIFMIGVPLAPNYGLALVFSVIGGISVAFLDGGTYPTLMESFPKKAGSATVFLKAFISLGSLLLPFLITFLLNNDIFFGWSFFIPAIVFLVNFVWLINVKFPQANVVGDGNGEAVFKRFNDKPKFHVEGIALIGIGFTAPALLYLMQTWIPTFAQEVIGMSLTSSLKLISYYSIGSFISVIIVSLAMQKWLKAVDVLVIYPVASLLSTIGLINANSALGASVMCFIIGFFLAGVMQIALSVMCEFFWQKKGTITGIFCTATSAAAAGIPLITGMITRITDVSGVLTFSLAINITGLVLALIANYRYKKLIKTVEVELESAA